MASLTHAIGILRLPMITRVIHSSKRAAERNNRSLIAFARLADSRIRKNPGRETTIRTQRTPRCAATQTLPSGLSPAARVGKHIRSPTSRHWDCALRRGWACRPRSPARDRPRVHRGQLDGLQRSPRCTNKLLCPQLTLKDRPREKPASTRASSFPETADAEHSTRAYLRDGR